MYEGVELLGQLKRTRKQRTVLLIGVCSHHRHHHHDQGFANIGCDMHKQKVPLSPPLTLGMSQKTLQSTFQDEQLSTLPLLRKLSLAKKLQNTGYILKGPRSSINQTNTK